MSDKDAKRIDDKLLGKVSGGVNRAKYLPNDYGERIYKDKAKDYIGQNVYIVQDADRENYAWGILQDVKQQNTTKYVITLT